MEIQLKSKIEKNKMFENQKTCLVGYGYWGKILHRNLMELGIQEVKVIDDVLGNTEELTDAYSHYIVATPFSTHQELVKKISQFGFKKIWCEKPLVPTLNEANDLYAIASSSSCQIFVDWIYDFNPAVNFLSEYLKEKKIKQILLNRTNDGPVRHDCKSILDLSSHDLTILLKIFGIKNSKLNFNWNEFSLKTNENFGSNLSWSYRQGTQIILNSSWQHTTKNRISIFITEKDEIILFDDIKKTVTLVGDRIEDFSNFPSPLHSSLKFFLDDEIQEFNHNQALTLELTRLLQKVK